MTKKPGRIPDKGIDYVAPMLYSWKSRKHLRSAGAADRDRDHPPNAILQGLTGRVRKSGGGGGGWAREAGRGGGVFRVLGGVRGRGRA